MKRIYWILFLLAVVLIAFISVIKLKKHTPTEIVNLKENISSNIEASTLSSKPTVNNISLQHPSNQDNNTNLIASNNKIPTQVTPTQGKVNNTQVELESSNTVPLQSGTVCHITFPSDYQPSTVRLTTNGGNWLPFITMDLDKGCWSINQISIDSSISSQTGYLSNFGVWRNKTNGLCSIGLNNNIDSANIPINQNKGTCRQYNHPDRWYIQADVANVPEGTKLGICIKSVESSNPITIVGIPYCSDLRTVQ